ncbi:hypothetical protein L195_g009336, partial [Trifolium pratense]
DFVSMILEKVKGDNAIVQNIIRSGKKDLYSELLWYLTFGMLRDDCCYDSCIFDTHGVSILEDLVIALADGVASVYLEFISVDSDVSSKTNSLDMSFCAMSTRELQKLRNEWSGSFNVVDFLVPFNGGISQLGSEKGSAMKVARFLYHEGNYGFSAMKVASVFGADADSSKMGSYGTTFLKASELIVALNQWLQHNMDTVVSMYEDRFDLCIFEKQPIDIPDISQTEKQSWWRNLTQQHSKTMSHELHCIAISHFSMPVKRTKELRSLTGWRYYFSLLLELSDITMPIVRTVINKASEAISFFLVSLIGRSLGLIYTGIRQSLKWK